jgi:DNA-binding NarL/FixJ family response regulator
VIRIVVADDQALFREGLKAVLTVDPALLVVAECANGEEALRACEQHRPQVVLMDLSMPIMNGVIATRKLKVLQPSCQVLVLTTFDEDEWLFEALCAGAVGYLLKDATAERLREAVHVAARGESFLDPAVASKVLAELSRLRAHVSAGSGDGQQGPFTSRELDVLKLLVRGASNKEIAAALFLSEGTVKNHVTHILSKLQVSGRTQAALRARELGYG